MPVKSHFLSALQGQNTLRPPVWLMRQAGRYMPEYRELRSKHSFLDLCFNPDLVVEVTLLPLKQFALDAAIVFSDILLPFKALNIPFHFEENKGPIIGSNVDFFNLPSFDAHRFRHLFSFLQVAIRNLKKELHVPLVGFAGAPFTLAAYLIEGGTSHHFEKTKLFAMEHPKQFHHLLDLLADLVRESLLLQIEAGVDAIQLFDTHLNILAPQEVKHFILPSLTKVFHGLKVPTILFSKGNHWDQLVGIRTDAISVDWTNNLPLLRSKYPTLVLQGNLDPVALLGSKETVIKQTRKILDGIGGDPAFIFNLGHGILPGTSPDAVHTLIETVHSHSPSIL